MAPSRAGKGTKVTHKREHSPEIFAEEDGESDPSVLDTAEGGDVNDSDEESSEEEEEGSGGSGEDEDEPGASKRLSTVSFGSLSKVLDGLEDGGGGNRKRKRKRGVEKSEDAEAKLEALRKRLRELREGKGKDGGAGNKVEKSSTVVTESTGHSKEDRSEADGSDSDGDDSSDPEEEAMTKKGRSSKHAPTSMSSKRAVTRRRDAIPLSKSKIRDPRFDPLTGPLDAEAVRRKYAFLDTYQADEMSTLRTSIKNPKLPDTEKEILKRQLLSMQSKQKAKEKEDLEKKVLREHRKKEREMIEQGKKPFYLKRSEQKKQALVERFGGMKEKEKNRVIERRRKKLSGKERKGLPEVRRA